MNKNFYFIIVLIVFFIVTAFKASFDLKGKNTSEINLAGLNKSLRTETNCRYEKAFEDCAPAYISIKHKAGDCPVCEEFHDEDFVELVPGGIGIRVICDDVPTGPACMSDSDCR